MRESRRSPEYLGKVGPDLPASQVRINIAEAFLLQLSSDLVNRKSSNLTKCGSPGLIRTGGRPINSRMLYR
jgi:hypothetical protein